MSYSLDRERKKYPQRRKRQMKSYSAHKKAGLCWKCKRGTIANPGGAWCQDCIESERLRRKSDAR